MSDIKSKITLHNPLLNKINLSIFLCGMISSNVWGQENIPVVAKSQSKIGAFLNRTQFSIRKNRQQFRLFQGIGPIWVSGEASSSLEFLGVGVGGRKAIGVNPRYWLGGYCYLPSETLKSLSSIPVFGTIGVELGNQSLQGNINLSLSGVSGQLALYCWEFNLLGVGILPHLGSDYRNGMGLFGKATLTLPKFLKWCAVEVKGSKWANIDVALTIAKPSEAKRHWLDRQMNIMPYLDGLSNHNPSNSSVSRHDVHVTTNPKLQDELYKNWENAISSKDFEGASAVLDAGLDVNTSDSNGYALLFKLGEDSPEKLQLMQKLLKAGANPNYKTHEGVKPLDLAAKNHQYKSIELLLNHGAEINSQDLDGNSPLSKAVETALHPNFSGNLESIKLLIKRGADVNVKIDAMPLIMRAIQALTFKPKIQTQDRELIKLLLAKGAAIDATDQDGATTLHWAAELGKYDTAVFLLETLGADPTIKDNGGKDALACVGKRGEAESVIKLLNYYNKKPKILPTTE